MSLPERYTPDEKDEMPRVPPDVLKRILSNHAADILELRNCVPLEDPFDVRAAELSKLYDRWRNCTMYTTLTSLHM
jgi:hypothetical protein